MTLCQRISVVATILTGIFYAYTPPVLAADLSFSLQANGMFTLAEELYPSLFQSGSGPQSYLDYVYRAFPSGVYVGVKNERVYLVGGPFGPGIIQNGTVGSVLAQLQNIKDQQSTSGGSVTGTVWYVDAAKGSDTTGDGSKTKPWSTIQKATAKLTAGATILVQPGLYKGPIVINTKATESAPATLKAIAPGVVIDSSGTSRDAVFVDHAAYITIDGITVQKATRAGLRISLSPHVTVKNSAFLDNGTWGIFTDFSDYTLVEDCETARSGTQHGIYISNSSDFPTLRRNHAHHNKGNGIHLNGDLSSGGDGIISGGLIEGNIIFENGSGGGSAINMDGVLNTTIRNNLLYDNHASGISVFKEDGATFSSNNRIYHNTIVMAANSRWAINMPNAGSKDNKVFNNIIFHPTSTRGAIFIGANNPTGFESDYNVMVARFSVDDRAVSGTAWQALGHDKHSKFTTPEAVFADPAAKVYTLKAGSPALNTGIPLTETEKVANDLNGQVRPQGAGVDMGAFELPGG
jgi:parallel beta-helix repeat protein